jgi:hypothetical protein
MSYKWFLIETEAFQVTVGTTKRYSPVPLSGDNLNVGNIVVVLITDT